MKYRAILIDDEPLALDRLERLLQRRRGFRCALATTSAF